MLVFGGVNMPTEIVGEAHSFSSNPRWTPLPFDFAFFAVQFRSPRFAVGGVLFCPSPSASAASICLPGSSGVGGMWWWTLEHKKIFAASLPAHGKRLRHRAIGSFAHVTSATRSGAADPGETDQSQFAG